MRVYFDTCAFIEAFEKSTPISFLLLQFLDWSRHGSPLVVTSELTLPEVLDKPMKDGEERLALFYGGFLRTTDTLRVEPVSRDILVAAARFRAQGLCAKLPDAIHVATAVEAGCSAFVTNDIRLRLPKEISLVGHDHAQLSALLQLRHDG